MPSRDRAQIRIEVLGAIKAALEARTTAEAFDELGDNVSQAERAAIAATFAVKGLTRQVRQLGEASLFAGLSLSSATIAMTGMRIAAYGLAAIALPALAVALGHVAAAAGAWTVAFTGGMFAIAAAAGLMAAGVIGRFRLMRNVAGSAANDLATQAGLLKHTFLDVTATGADRIMRGLADAITDLLPLLRQLAPSFDAIGQAAGSLFRSIGAQLATMGPELQVMFAQLVPVLTEAGPLLGKLLGFLIQIGTVGAPLVASAFRTISGWLDHWTATFTGATLQHAQDTLRGFAASIGAFFAGIGEPLRGVLGPAIADLAAAWQANGREIGRTLGLLAAILVRLGRVVLPLVITGIKILGGLLAWVNKHFHTLLTIATPLAIAIGAYQVAATGAAAASKLLGVGMAIYRTAAALATGQTLALDAAMAANPIGLVVAAIALLAAGLVLAYKKVGWFRDAVNATWGALKTAFGWVADHWRLLIGPLGNVVVLIVEHFDDIVGFVKALPARIAGAATGMWDGLKNGVVAAINWIVGKLNWLIRAYRSTAGRIPFAPTIHEITPLGVTQTTKGMATGGVMTMPGWRWVGEQGPELIRLPSRTTVLPAGESRKLTRSDRPVVSPGRDDGAVAIEVTIPIEATLDGDVVFKAVERRRLDHDGRR